MTGKNPAKKLLQCAIQAGNANSGNEVASESDRKWLSEAVKNISSSHINLVDRLKECILVLQAANTDSSITSEDLIVTMEEISSLCEDIDLACDLHKIGGLDSITQHLQHEDTDVQLAAADVIAVISQNNEFCQNVLLNDYNILSMLLQKTLEHNDEQESNVAVKSMYAISCLVRHSEIGFANFVSNDGFDYLLKGMQSDVSKLQIKSVFLLSSLSKEDSTKVNVLNSHEYIMALVKILNVDNNFDLIEYALNTLTTLSCHNVEFRNMCLEKRKEFKSAIGSLLSHDAIRNDRQEIINFCKQLNAVFNL